MTPKELRDRMMALLSEMESAQSEGDEERFTAAEAEIEEVRAKLAKAEEREAKLAKAREEIRARATQVAQENERRGAMAMSAISGGSRVEVNPEDRARFDSLGQNVREAFYFHQNKRGIVGGVMEARASAGYAERPDEKGGILLQEDLVVDMGIQQVTTPGIIEMCRQLTIQGNAVRIPHPKNYDQSAGHTGVGTATWMGEAGVLTPAAGSFEQRRYEMKKVGSIVPITDDLMDDVRFMESLIRTMVPLDLRASIHKSIISGDTPSEPSGILGATALISIAKEDSQQAATVVFENIVKMWAQLLPSSKTNAVWIVHPSVIPQLQQMAIVVGTGGLPVYLPPAGVSGAPHGSLFGRPVIEDQYCSVLGTKGDIILADMSQYMLVMKGGVKEAVSMHLYFTSDQGAMRFVQRADGGVYPSSVYTLADGSYEMGSFITLDARA